ncbi:MAG: hypothetical protein FWC95_02880 [Defluviitaleaceae bacterium]|nr:hypothetical protein [Defluviitaleaceae bacterium]
MPNYVIMLNPGHNRVYFDSAIQMAIKEFTLAAGCGNSAPEIIKIGGIDYLRFDSEILSPEEINRLHNLSFTYAIFEKRGGSGDVALHPITGTFEPFVPASFSQILKYTGKTNELFTRMCINIAQNTIQHKHDSINLLDPMMGKGTTLYEGFIRGFNVYGVELDDGLVTESHNFVKRFMEKERYKFEQKTIKISGPNKSFRAERHSFTVARSKDDEKAGNTRTIEMIAGNTIHSDSYFKKDFFDIIMCDLPYGVQHDSAARKAKGGSRNPIELLKQTLPVWRGVLKPGGAITLAWNTFVCPRNEIVKTLEESSFAVQATEPHMQLRHRVDQAIMRDMVVAIKL